MEPADTELIRDIRAVLRREDPLSLAQFVSGSGAIGAAELSPRPPAE